VLHPATKDPATGRFKTVAVRKLEEKGSDVNLATHMIVDAHTGAADMYVMLSNDSDLAEPIRMLKHNLGCQTGIIFPMPTSRNSKELVKTEPDLIANIDRAALAACQYPDVLTDSVGNFRRPKAWKQDSGPASCTPSG